MARDSKQFIVLEDSGTQGRLISSMFERAGAAAHLFTCVEDFTKDDELGFLEIDAAIVDIHFGKVNGLDLIEPILDLWPNVVLVMMTANKTNDFAVLADARERGAHLVLKKPFGAKEVSGVIQDVELIRSKGAPRHHIVVIDDNRTTCQIVQDILETYNFRVTTFQAGEFAMGRMNFDRVDAVLTDFNMPGMSGGELICLVRDVWEDVPIVGMSTESDSRNAHSDSVHAFVNKPFGPEELVNKLNGVIKRHFTPA